MRAKFRVHTVDQTYLGKEGDPYRSITVRASAVCKDGAYPADGSDEDNTFARWTPQGELSLVITNPDLLDKVAQGDLFYLDFHRAVPVPPTA